MSRATGPASLALAASLAAAVAGCKATDEAERKGAPPPPPPPSAASRAAATPPAQKPPGPPADPHGHAADVRRVSVEEARSAVERGEAVFVDVRGDDAFREGHLPGAISIPAGEVARRASQLPAGKQIITYCA